MIDNCNLFGRGSLVHDPLLEPQLNISYIELDLRRLSKCKTFSYRVIFHYSNLDGLLLLVQGEVVVLSFFGKISLEVVGSSI